MNIVSLSGGKDSTAMLFMMLDRGIPVDKIVFADVGDMAEFSEMYDYITRVANYIGREIITVCSEKHTAESIFFGRFVRGKRVGEMRGFPPTVGSACGYRRDLKVRPLKIACGEGNNVFIGIAADEEHRSRAKEYANGKNNYCFPLVEWGITESECMEYLKSKGLYNSLYDYFDRIGCWWCPKQPIKSLRSLYRHFPDKWQSLRRLEEIHGKPFKHGYPSWELEQRFMDELVEEKERQEMAAAQMCLFDTAA